MTEVERYLEVKAKRESLASKMVAYPVQLTSLKAAAQDLHEKMLRAEIIDGEADLELKLAVAENSKAIAALQIEVEDGQTKLRVMDQLRLEVRMYAEKHEITPKYQQAFQKALNEFVERLREAHAAEVALAAIRDEAKKACLEIDSIAYPIESWTPILMSAQQDFRIKPDIENFINAMKAKNYKIR